MITIQSADAALKDYYLDAVSEQLNNNISPFFSAIEKNSDSVSGKDVKLAVVRGYSGSIVAGSEDGDLPSPYKNRYANITVPLKNIYGTIEISDKAMRASRESSGAFVNLINAEMEGLIANAKQNFGRMLFGNGSGKLCSIKAKIEGNRYTVDCAREYFIGMQVDVYTTAGKPVEGYGDLYIVAASVPGNAVTFNREINDLIVGGEIYVHGAKNNELTGLDAIFSDDPTIYGFNKSEDIYFAPHDIRTTDKVSENAICEIIDYMEENRNSKINMIICSFKMRRNIAQLADANRRVVNTTDMHGGYGAISISGIPVYADKFCPDDRIYVLNTDDFALYQLCDWEWLEDEDGKILKQIPGKAGYSATLVKYAELVCRRPCGQAVLKFRESR